MIKVGLPKGVLKKKSIKLAEYICQCMLFDSQLKVSNEKYIFFFLKHRDIPKFISSGIIDVGITSDEWIRETSSEKIKEIMAINWCHTKMALIVKNKDRKIKKCSTEFLNISKKYFNNSPVDILYISGSSETLIPEITDASIDCVETGKTLRDNNLLIKEVIFESDIKLIARHDIENTMIMEIIDYLEEFRL